MTMWTAEVNQVNFSRVMGLHKYETRNMKNAIRQALHEFPSGFSRSHEVSRPLESKLALLNMVLKLPPSLSVMLFCVGLSKLDGASIKEISKELCAHVGLQHFWWTKQLYPLTVCGSGIGSTFTWKWYDHLISSAPTNNVQAFDTMIKVF